MFGVIRLQVLTPSPMVLATISFTDVQERQIDMFTLQYAHIYMHWWPNVFNRNHSCGASEPAIVTLGVLQGSSISSAGKASRVYGNRLSTFD